MTNLTPAPNGYAIKLVRDRTPEILNSSGVPGGLFYRAYRGNPMPWLKKKLGEEVCEYVVEGTVDELADVLAVVDALAVQHGISPQRLREMAESDERGGFLTTQMMYGHHPEFDGGAL